MSPYARRGAALLAVTVVISVLGALATAASWAARQRQVGARRLRAIHAADGAVARLLDSALATWPATARASMALGARVQLRSGAGGEWLAVTRLTRDHYRLDAVARRGDALASARDAASLLVRIDRPRLAHRAPLVVAGSAVVGPAFTVSAGAEPGCALPTTATADLLAADASRVDWRGAAGVVAEEPGLAPPAAAGLARRSDVTVADGGAWRPASDSARVVAGAGAMTLGPGRGAGLVVVAGPLTLVGPLEFTGVVVAPAGVTHAGGADVTLRGALLTGGVAELAGPGSLRASECAVRAAEDAAGRAVPPPTWGMAFEP